MNKLAKVNGGQQSKSSTGYIWTLLLFTYLLLLLLLGTYSTLSPLMLLFNMSTVWHMLKIRFLKI